MYCGTTYCEYTPVYTLDYKDYTWFITLHNGSYSTTNSLDFVVSSPSFSSGFNGSKAGWARYKTPIDGLWMCASGTHPGGGIMGAPGQLAAVRMLKEGAL